MKSSPLVSVCIPAYNCEKYLSEALDSALNQSYSPIEIICVNDGSTDKTSAVLANYGNAIRVIDVKNGGAPAARNIALAASKGEYIQFLDADNIMHPRKIELQVRYLIDNDADLVFCNKSIQHEDSSIVDREPPPSPENIDPFYYCLKYNFPGGRAVIDTEVPLHRRSFLEKAGGFRDGVMRAQDKDLAIRLAAAGARFHYVDEILMIYREHSGPRISHKVKDPGYNLRIMLELWGLLENNSVYDLNAQREMELALRIIQKSKKYYRLGATKDAIRGFNKALSVCPEGDNFESLLYKLIRRFLGYNGTEKLLKLLRF